MEKARLRLDAGLYNTLGGVGGVGGVSAGPPTRCLNP
jgi:hypothetical protein